jgi:hypothetical protein
MGQSTDGILAYGYDLGGEEEGWTVREAGEYGELSLDWLPDPEAEEGYDIPDLMLTRLLEASGFAETDWQAGGYFARKHAAEAALGVEIESYCSGEYPLYLLAAKVITVNRGDVKPVDMAALSDPAVLAAYDAKLASALHVLGVTPVQDKPAWLLCSYWG